ARCVAGSTREANRVTRKLFRIGLRDRGAAAEHFLHRQRALDALAGGKRVALPDRVHDPALDRSNLERDGDLVHLRLGGEAGLDGTEATHGAAGWVVGED